MQLRWEIIGTTTMLLALMTALLILISTEPSKDITSNKANFHYNITSTVFWVGESATEDNGYIDNLSSAWDQNWVNNFTNNDNKFYVALPYNDIDEQGNRKNTAQYCKQFNTSKMENYSWCKNNWIEIKANGKTAFGQWQDVGPYKEDDFEYVFGNKMPSNITTPKAGIDLSPALQKYLNINDIDSVSWRFVKQDQVSNGPWLEKITNSTGDKL